MEVGRLSTRATTRGWWKFPRGGSLYATNSIIAGNTASASPITSSLNISSYITSGANNLIDVDPMLAPLGHYGGPTPTRPPLPGSPAIDAGLNTGSLPATDQRGFARVVNGVVDIGAVEGVFNPAFSLLNLTKLGNGNLQFGFTNLSGPSYSVLATTNVAAPLNTWSNLGPAVEAPPGTFQFTDLQATNYPLRFYRVQGP